MTVDLHGSDPVPAQASRTAVEQLVACARERLGAETEPPWKIVSFRSKMSKTIFEVEDGQGRRLIGKVSKSDRAALTWTRLRMLWDAGMRPPSLYTVTEPLAWLPEQRLLLQAKAEGEMLLDLIRRRDPAALEGAVAAGEWVQTLQKLNIATEAAPDFGPAIQRCADELSTALPREGERIRRTADALLERLPATGSLVPSHGDFHPMNVFPGGGGRLTAIDLDTFAGREPAADVAYFAAQTAIMGYLALGDFDSTRQLRLAFLDNAPAADPERLDVHTRVAFLRTLHFDQCILKLDAQAEVEPFLRVVENGLPA